MNNKAHIQFTTTFSCCCCCCFCGIPQVCWSDTLHCGIDKSSCCLCWGPDVSCTVCAQSGPHTEEVSSSTTGLWPTASEWTSCGETALVWPWRFFMSNHLSTANEGHPLFFLIRSFPHANTAASCSFSWITSVSTMLPLPSMSSWPVTGSIFPVNM